MRSPLPLRRRAILWLLLPAVPLLIIVAQLSPATLVLDWWTWIVAHSALLIIVPAAVASTGAALDAARLRVRREENALAVRAPARILLDAFWPSYVGGVLAQIAAVMIVAFTASGGRGAPPWGLIGALLAMLLFHTALGLMCGSVLRPVFAIPAALAASYVWLGFTGVVDWFELRHLAGLVLETCCFYDQQPAASSIASVSAFSVLAGVGLILLASAALRIPVISTITATAAGSSLMVVGFVLGIVAAQGLGPSAAEARDERDLTCTEAAVTVCLYPEQWDPAVVRSVQTMVQRVIDAGVPLATRVVATREPENRGVLPFAFIPGMTEGEIATSLAGAIPDGTCESDDEERSLARSAAFFTTYGWLEGTLLGTPGAGSYADDPESYLDVLLERPPTEQAKWINAAIASLGDCGTLPPGAP
ncbi:hypothetical protein [Microbacterium sp.]|uniref:DUF7224 domain-containing protein n=1 Tax=Microbacterium sp. TaxID=51671 RepID=UPI0039E6D581